MLLTLISINAAQPVVINVEDYKNSDVTVQPAIPWEQAEAAILVRCYNNDSPHEGPFSILLRDKLDQKIIDQASISIKSGTSETARLKWTPKANGWRTLQVIVRSQAGAEILVKEVTVPVVAKPLTFAWYGGSLERDKSLKYVTILQAHTSQPDETLGWMDYWERRGVRACQWKGVLKEKSGDDYLAYLDEGVDPQKHPKSENIWIDEMGGYSDNELPYPELVGALGKFNEKNPDTWTGLWICGALRPGFCKLAKNPYRKSGVDLLLLETYANYKLTEFKSYNPFAYFDHDISVARTQDVLSNVILTLGIGDIKSAGYVVTTSSLEDQVRYIRTNAPEIAGVGFFKSDESEEIVKFSDELCRKYWVEPLVTIWARDIVFSNYNPKEGDEVMLSASVFNIGGMDAKDINVTFYDNDPRMGGNQIGKVHKLPLITPTQGCPGGRADVKQAWRASKGNHEIFVRIDSQSGEIRTLNASASKPLHVQ